MPMDPIDAVLYMPSSFHCETCGFNVELAFVRIDDGTVVHPEVEAMDGTCCPHDGTLLRRTTWKEGFEMATKTAQDLAIGLTEAVKLMDHYGQLLNAHDGGRRLKLTGGMQQWMNRLVEIGKITK